MVFLSVVPGTSTKLAETANEDSERMSGIRGQSPNVRDVLPAPVLVRVDRDL